MMSTILEFAATAIQLITTASDMRRKFFQYGVCLLLLAVSGGFLIAGTGFLIWALYDGLSIVLASPIGARIVLFFFSFGLAGILIWSSKKVIS